MKPHPQLVAIAAMAKNRIIGKEGGIPWHIPDEMRWFRKTTTGHAVLMGRKTFESLGKPLPNRINIVATRGSGFPDTVTIRDIESFDPALYVAPHQKVYVIGGAEIYAEFLPRCSELLLTHLNEDAEGDTVFPEFEKYFEKGEVIATHEKFVIVRYATCY
jgi:dihydrofolate reductase